MLCTCVDGDRCSLDDAGGDQTLGLHGELVLSLWLYCHQGLALVPKLSKHLLLKWWQWAEIDFWIQGVRTRMGIQNCNSTFRGCDEKIFSNFLRLGIWREFEAVIPGSGWEPQFPLTPQLCGWEWCGKRSTDIPETFKLKQMKATWWDIQPPWLAWTPQSCHSQSAGTCHTPRRLFLPSILCSLLSTTSWLGWVMSLQCIKQNGTLHPTLPGQSLCWKVSTKLVWNYI